MSGAFDLCGVLRRIRRIADLSQRELASAAELSVSAVAHAEAGTRDLPVRSLGRIAAVAGLRVAVLNGAGEEVTAMSGDAVRDQSGRRFPAHLDTRYGDDGWWHGPERYSRRQPWYTFDRLRYTRDHWRSRTGTPDDHQLPQPGDSPEDRTAARRRAAWQREKERREKARRDAPWRPLVDAFTCECPPTCAELDDHRGMPVHAPDCPCQCDVG